MDMQHLGSPPCFKLGCQSWLILHFRYPKNQKIPPHTKKESNPWFLIHEETSHPPPSPSPPRLGVPYDWKSKNIHGSLIWTDAGLSTGFAGLHSCLSYISKICTTGQKNRALQLPPVVPYKVSENFSKALYGTTRGTCIARFFPSCRELCWKMGSRRIIFASLVRDHIVAVQVI